MANEHRHQEAKDTPPLDKRGATRRRLAKAGVGAAGVLWTLESKATYGHGMVCAAPSKALSTGLKSTYGPKPTCEGWPPGTWCKIGHMWPCSDSIKFSSVFTCNRSNANTYGKVSMLDLLEGKSWDSYGLGAELVAAYLNVLSGKISFLTKEKLQSMWAQIQKGRYEAAKDVFWNAQQLKYYLSLTHY